jgi:ELWxxDGT repeat protein
MKSLAVCALLALLALPAAGLEPYLVKDLDPVPVPAGSDPSRPVTFGGAVLFFADDGIGGHELWRSDGTAAGTWQLSETLSSELPDPRPFLVTERLYFFVDSNPEGFDASLWVSDGTSAGTFRLTQRGVAVGGERLWVAREDVLYFAAWDLEHGVELWRTDGTPGGTWLVADVRPGPEGSGVQWLTEYRGRVWFGADDGERGGALWRTRLEARPLPPSCRLDRLPAPALLPGPGHPLGDGRHRGLGREALR